MGCGHGMLWWKGAGRLGIGPQGHCTPRGSRTGCSTPFRGIYGIREQNTPQEPPKPAEHCNTVT
jgi:hypothetical protein